MEVVTTPIPAIMCVSLCKSPRKLTIPGKSLNPVSLLQARNYVSYLQRSSISPSYINNPLLRRRHCDGISSWVIRSAATSAGNANEYSEESATKVKFQRLVTLPGCSTPLSLLGTGFREKTFAIIGVKVYAAGLYINETILNSLTTWKGKSAAEIQRDSSLFKTIFRDEAEKSLQIVLVRDVDGKTFWDALDEAITPRIKSQSSEDKSALSTFRGIFETRPLKKGSIILLTWIKPSKMAVSVSQGGLPTNVDAEIESGNVTFALFDVFFGDSSVSPTLKSSVAEQLALSL